MPGHPKTDSEHPDPDMAPTLWRGYATEAEAEAKARELLDDFKRRSLPVARDVLVGSDSGPRAPGAPSDLLRFIGRWEPGVGIVDELGNPLHDD